MSDKIGFVFDMDGTLINSTEIGGKIEKTIYNKFDIEIDEKTEKEIQHLTYEIMHGENRKNLGTKLLWAIFKKLGLNLFQRLQALVISGRIFRRENKRVKLYDGVEETFDFFDEQGYKYSIATTSSRKEVEERLKKFQSLFTKLDGNIITRSDVENLKPNPESIIKASNKMNVALDKLIMVGDMHSDIMMGKNVNAITIAVLTGIFTKEEFMKYKPDFIIDSVANIPELMPDIIKKLNISK